MPLSLEFLFLPRRLHFKLLFWNNKKKQKKREKNKTNSKTNDFPPGLVHAAPTNNTKKKKTLCTEPVLGQVIVETKKK